MSLFYMPESMYIRGTKAKPKTQKCQILKEIDQNNAFLCFSAKISLRNEFWKHLEKISFGGVYSSRVGKVLSKYGSLN